MTIEITQLPSEDKLVTLKWSTHTELVIPVF